MDGYLGLILRIFLYLFPIGLSLWLGSEKIFRHRVQRNIERKTKIVDAATLYMSNKPVYLLELAISFASGVALLFLSVFFLVGAVIMLNMGGDSVFSLIHTSSIIVASFVSGFSGTFKIRDFLVNAICAVMAETAVKERVESTKGQHDDADVNQEQLP